MNSDSNKIWRVIALDPPSFYLLLNKRAAVSSIVSKRVIKGGFIWNSRNVFNLNINLCSETWTPVPDYIGAIVP